MKLFGLCVSKGNATGTIKILHENINPHFTDPTIIVMKKLDREYLVNMDSNVVGVIAEEGNIGSHGAGILRQLRIPCILRIENATTKIIENTNATILGTESCINCSVAEKHYPAKLTSTDDENDLTYTNISKEFFGIDDIKPINSWICPRPDRVYQELRFSIICDVFSSSGSFLFGLPEAKVKRNNNGAIITYGSPSIPDVCSFLINNPSWLIDKSKERTIEFDSIKKILNEMKDKLNEESLSRAYEIFQIGITLYRSLFKYAYISQAISDEVLEIYLDFIHTITGNKVSKDILNLQSEYVRLCITSGIDPGVSQKWDSQKTVPHVWEGKINYDKLDVDQDIINAINISHEHNRLMHDYESFRLIVPLVYQLSEEFFYVSSSINSFINWSIVTICKKINKNNPNLDVKECYNMPLTKFSKLVKTQLYKEIMYE